MDIEIDMSGRIEDTNKPTVIAFSNHTNCAVLIKSTEKILLLDAIKKLKPEWSSTLRHVYIFSTLVSILLDTLQDENVYIQIDPEYLGYESVIKNRVLTFLRNPRFELRSDRIAFAHVGKKSRSHEIAIEVFRGNTKPSRILTAQEVLEYF